MTGSTEHLNSLDNPSIGMSAGSAVKEECKVNGHYSLSCTDSEGNVLWTDEVDNVVTYVGQNEILNSSLAGSSYSVTGPYMLLISSASFSAVSVNDTMSSHAGWLEADSINAPEYSGNRPTVTFGAASSGAAAITPVSFVFTNSGTVQGIAMTFGPSASNTQGATTGVLLSAGTLAAAQPVINGNTINASYTLTL